MRMYSAAQSGEEGEGTGAERQEWQSHYEATGTVIRHCPLTKHTDTHTLM